MTYYTADWIKPTVLGIARRIERLHIGKLKRGKLSQSADEEVIKLMLIYNSIDWWEADKIKKVLLWLKVNYGI